MKATPENEALLKAAISAVNRNSVALRKREKILNRCVEIINCLQQVKANVRKECFDLCSVNQSLDVPEEYDVLNKELAVKTRLNYHAIDQLLKPSQLEVSLGISSGELKESIFEMLKRIAEEYDWEDILKEARQCRGDFKKITTSDVLHIARKKERLEY